VLPPLNVNAAVPVFTNPPDPLITPLNVVSAVPPNVKLKLCNSTEPAPAIEPTVSDAFNRTVAPDDTETGAMSKIAAPPDNASVPAATDAPSVFVFVPDNVNSPTPAFVNWKEPDTIPVKVTGL
jgi:hypothetical protein